MKGKNTKEKKEQAAKQLRDETRFMTDKEVKSVLRMFKQRGGQPMPFDGRKGDEICMRVALGQPLPDISQVKGMPDLYSMLCWIRPTRQFKESSPSELSEFGEAYKNARHQQLELAYDELIAISDKARNKDDAPAVKIRVETRKFALERLLHKEFSPANRAVEDDDVETYADKMEAAARIIAERRAKRMKDVAVLDDASTDGDVVTIEARELTMHDGGVDES